MKSIFNWNDPKTRGLVYQGLTFSIVLGTFLYLFFETQNNLEKQNISSGFSFLFTEAGFDIGESIFEYSPEDSYLKALLVGFLNTFKIAIVGNILAVILGLVVALGRMSKNYLLSVISKSYIEVIRNTPLLLQLLFWYALITESFPSVRSAFNPLPSIFLSNRGLYLPALGDSKTWPFVLGSFIVSGIIFYFVKKKSDRLQDETGQELALLKIGLCLLIGLPLITWVVGGVPLDFSIPELKGFNFRGGYHFTSEFLALLVGLVLYVGAFNAEIIRSGIESVDKGQWEAASALSLTPFQTMRFVILPQAQRVIIPPITSQILNLTKNSSLAVAIGYPDFVSVANTSMNQTGQAIEMVALIMACYLFYSLLTSFFMNWYNKNMSLKERS